MLQALVKTAVLAASVTVGSAAANAASLQPLITPAQLDDLLKAADAPAILDIRGAAYQDGHVLRAVSAPYDLFRGPAENPGQIVPVKTLETTYESLGLHPAEPVVIVSQGATDGDFGAAARVYWTLKSSGFTDLSILNGGATAWANAGLPVSTEAVAPTVTELDITWNNQWTATTADVQDAVAGNSKAVLVDARPPAFFEGEKAHEVAARPGTLPGAQNVPYTDFFTPGATAISTSSNVAALKDRLGITDGQPVVSFCNTGHWAATDWFAMSEISGIKDAKLYPGSMVEYSQTGGKMDNVPGLFRNLLRQFQGE
ncbi:MAG: sulfurtransferase [Paracoccus sp. (in: a-proteobacteria)]|nr:sulfurtransferase [Paracoccus sp. (in: a-proteobacteria)]